MSTTTQNFLSRMELSKAAMNYDAICRWLKLTDVQWPPDHYTLLGLPRGEADPVRIETAVYDKMARVRCYQLSHPDLVTEAMNRLAAAFACLSQADSKQRYDDSLGLPPRPLAAAPASPATPSVRGNSADETITGGLSAVVDWRQTTPPVRHPAAAGETVEIPRVAAPVAEELTPPTAAVKELAVPTAKPADPILELARKSRSARRGLGTRRALVERVRLTRRLLLVWQRVGRLCGHARRSLTGEKDQQYLKYWLAQVEELVQEFPPIFGRPAQPGYRVAILAQDEDPVREFERMELAEREQLALDWKTASGFLQTHRQFLRKLIRDRRRQSRLIRWTVPLTGWIEDHPRWFLALVAVFILGVTFTALWR